LAGFSEGVYTRAKGTTDLLISPLDRRPVGQARVLLLAAPGG